MTQPTPDPGKAPTVLLVEDLQDDVFFFRLALKRAEVQANLHIATDGTQAVDYFTNRGAFEDASLHPAPDIVFLDLKMPNMNGFEVLEWLKNNPPARPAKVIVLTGSEEPGDRVRAAQLGASAYLVKPPRREVLLELFATLPQATPVN